MDTNPRYREVIKFILNFSGGLLAIPVFVARTILSVPKEQALITAFDARIYTAWVFLLIAMFSCVVFYYASACWIRLAWKLPTRMFGIKASDIGIEAVLDWSFWISWFSFIIGAGLILWFFLTKI